MDKGSSNQHTGTKVLGEEEDLGGDVQPLDLLRHNGETTSSNTGEEDDDLPQC